MNVVILAAGQGKRMRSDHPKVCQPLAGRPLLGHVIATARAIGATRPIIVYGHAGDQVRATFANEALEWAKQDPPQGTVHAVQQAVSLLDELQPTFVLYGDVPLTRAATLERLIGAAAKGLALLTVDLPDPKGYGRIIREGGRVVRIVEEKDASPAERAVREVNTGILVAPTAALKRWLGQLNNKNAQREYYLTDIIAMAVADGVAIETRQPSDVWETLGVNSKVELARLERIHQSNIAAGLLEAGVTLADPGRIDVRGRLDCGRDVAIDVGCVFEGNVALADRVSVGPYCVLRNVTIGAGSRIEAFSHLDEATVGKNARIGPYARLRPLAELANDVHIGNFVEVKASQIGDGSKANHLAYIGDATIGKNVNVGAGTITCNYDGVNKHRTVIEDDAFIGSDTQLVAPVKVGRGATLSAGTTLTKDAPAGKLTISRAKQTTIEGWQRPAKKLKV
ncbi:MAG: bifunctional UDP-N-acetylglucosamine diphosphorylase/glucosamine-1-phosphate N-acetyltransferase GlmU [Burkholderiales bacterium]